MTQYVRLIAAANVNSAVAPGTILTTDMTSVRTLASFVAIARSGTTTQRPTNSDSGGPLPAGFMYFDTAVADLIIFDGVSWRSPITGAIV